MIKYIMILSLGGGKKPKDSLAIAEKNSIVEWRKKYEKDHYFIICCPNYARLSRLS